VRVFLSAVVAAVILVPGSAAAAAAPRDGSRDGSERDGSLVSAEALPAALRLAGAGDAWRLSYRTRS